MRRRAPGRRPTLGCILAFDVAHRVVDAVGTDSSVRDRHVLAGSFHHLGAT